MLIKIAGIDPSLSNFGMIKGELDTYDYSFTIEGMELITTSKTLTKTVRRNSEDLYRAQQLHHGMLSFLADIPLVCVEIPVGSQSARAMASYGICIGVLAALPMGVIQVTPTEVKLKATGDKKASKAKMIDWATTKHPHAQWYTRRVKGVTSFTQKNEHLADALATIYAGIMTNQYTQLTCLLKPGLNNENYSDRT